MKVTVHPTGSSEELVGHTYVSLETEGNDQNAEEMVRMLLSTMYGMTYMHESIIDAVETWLRETKPERKSKKKGGE